MGKVAVVGLGMIGGGVAGALLRAGHDVAVHDVRAEAAEPFAARGATVASSAGEAAAGRDVLVLAVVDDAQVREVLGAALPAMDAGAAVLVLSTVSVGTLAEVSAAAAARGVDVVDCGVTGGPRAAAEGALVSMLGGGDEAVARVLPVVESFSSKAVRLGGPGAGMRAKLVRNLMQYGMWAIAHEARNLAEAADLDVAALREVVEAGDARTGGPLALFGPRADADADPALRRAGAALAHKDLAAAMELADAVGAEVPLTRALEPGYDAVLGVAGAADGEDAEDARTAGLRMMGAVYNMPSYADAPRTPYLDLTIEHLFGRIWTRPGLDVRQRRLLTIGVLAALGRDELIELQFSSALDRGELTIDQLREVVVHLTHYVGWPQTTVIGPMVEKLARRRQAPPSGGTPAE
jgi:3-hydroxyisobutyrate dehydrogenase-like beta-hydroxyacid dehydrogenase